MDVYEFAIKMEQDGEQFYRRAASQTRDQGIKRIFNLLADDEGKHAGTVRQMQQAAPVQMAETAILTDAKNVFAQMQGQPFSLERPQIDVYRQAQEIERKSIEFYENKATQVVDPAHRALFGKIAEEERRHFFLLEHIIDFLARPEMWLENAEFNHLEEY